MWGLSGLSGFSWFVYSHVFTGKSVWRCYDVAYFLYHRALSSLIALNAAGSHYFGVDYEKISGFIEKLDRYGIEAQNANASGNHELAVTCGEKMVDEIRLFVSNIVDYQINKAKEEGDMERVKELESGRQKFIDEFNAKLQEKLGPDFEIDSAPVERELTPVQEIEE